MEFTYNNIYGIHLLLEACKVTNCIKRFIYVKTDEVHGKVDLETNIENHEAFQFLPTNSYSATKARVEMLARAYYMSYGLSTISIRGNNFYGPNNI